MEIVYARIPSKRGFVGLECRYQANWDSPGSSRVSSRMFLDCCPFAHASLSDRCPDLTISSLADDNNGRRVIEIARTIVASAIKYPKADNYLSVVSETWDQYFQINRMNQEAEPQLSPSHRHYRTLSEHRKLTSLTPESPVKLTSSLLRAEQVETTSLLFSSVVCVMVW